MSILALSGFVNGILILFLAFFFFLTMKKGKEYKIFFLLSLLISSWQINYGFWQIAETESASIIFLRLLMFSSLFSSVVLLHLSLVFLNIYEENKKILTVLYFVTFSLLSLIFSPFFILKTKACYFYDFWPIAGIGANLNFLWAFILTAISFRLLIKNYVKFKGEKKKQTAYLILALVIGALSGGLFNIPQWYGIDFFPYGNFFLPLFPLIIAFAIIRYHLFEIRIILTEILVGIMSSVLLILPFLMPTSFLRVITVIFLLLFIIFAYLLIKTTHQEIKRREEMEKLTKELQKAYRNIKALSKMKSEFLKVVNHQLRTPVSIVKGMLSIMEEGSVKGKKLKEFTRKSYLASERLSTILDDILTAQDLMAGERRLEVSPCSIKEIVESQVKHFKLIAKQKKLKLILEKSRDIFPLTLANPSMIERIVSRVIDNAILYTSSAKSGRGKKGEIKVSLKLKKSKDKRFIQISVKDSGLGLTKKDKKNLFKLFHRGEEAISLHPNGSGLGLSIVKKLVELHKGTIKVKSEGRNKGTTFIIRLPVSTEI